MATPTPPNNNTNNPPNNDNPRPLIIGPPLGPSPPYPLQMSGLVISGFGRGSKELGIPTANLPVDDAQTPWIAAIPSGVYFGWAALGLPGAHPDALSSRGAVAGATGGDAGGDADGVLSKRGSNGFAVYPMVMSIGYNPFYKNTVRSAEVHVLHKFGADFYGVEMRLLIAGFIREEKDYSGLEALIADIEFDCEVAKRSLAREGWAPSGVDVEVDVPGEGVKVLRGTLEGGWLIRPAELGEGGKL